MIIQPDDPSKQLTAADYELLERAFAKDTDLEILFSCGVAPGMDAIAARLELQKKLSRLTDDREQIERLWRASALWELFEQTNEVVQGVIREGQLCVLTGYYAIGKTPLVYDLAFHIKNGLPWLGRDTQAREVVSIDFETPDRDFNASVLGLDRRYPNHVRQPITHRLLTHGESPLKAVLAEKTWAPRLQFLRELLRSSPDALVIVDPVEHLFRFNRNWHSHVLSLYRDLRNVLSDFAHAAILIVMNHRRRGRRRRSLLADPQLWLEATAGDLDVLNRCDVRLGFDAHDDPELFVINGVRRGEAMEPILVRRVGTAGQWGGFERVELDRAALVFSLTPRQQEYWQRLPHEFRFLEIVERRIVPKSSLSRLVRAAHNVGLLRSEGGVHFKI